MAHLWPKAERFLGHGGHMHGATDSYICRIPWLSRRIHPWINIDPHVEERLRHCCVTPGFIGGCLPREWRGTAPRSPFVVVILPVASFYHANGAALRCQSNSTSGCQQRTLAIVDGPRMAFDCIKQLAYRPRRFTWTLTLSLGLTSLAMHVNFDQTPWHFARHLAGLTSLAIHVDFDQAPWHFSTSVYRRIMGHGGITCNGEPENQPDGPRGLSDRHEEESPLSCWSFSRCRVHPLSLDTSAKFQNAGTHGQQIWTSYQHGISCQPKLQRLLQLQRLQLQYGHTHCRGYICLWLTGTTTVNASSTQAEFRDPGLRRSHWKLRGPIAIVILLLQFI
ncbi:hypothetical protein JB92DRAFT_634930 [Gautieria morchelliformis]|nr:hypothetical protein JB92DRAFT_634930 [Gautieria morchelliformis]